MADVIRTAGGFSQAAPLNDVADARLNPSVRYRDVAAFEQAIG
jgi:hypothetical protein